MVSHLGISGIHFWLVIDVLIFTISRSQSKAIDNQDQLRQFMARRFLSGAISRGLPFAPTRCRLVVTRKLKYMGDPIILRRSVTVPIAGRSVIHYMVSTPSDDLSPRQIPPVVLLRMSSE